MCGGGSAELTWERDGWRKKLTATKSTLTVRLLQLGRSNGNIGSAEIKNGLIQQSTLRRNSDKEDMTPPESSEAPAQELKLTQISGS